MKAVTRRRNGWLGVISALLILLLIGDLLYLVLGVWGVGWFSVGTVGLNQFFGPDAYVARNHPDIDLREVTVAISHYTLWQEFLYRVGHGLATAVVTVPLLVMAVRLVDRTRVGDPFTDDMVHRLRRLGYAVLGGGAVCSAAEYSSSVALLHSALPAALHDHALPNYDVSTWWLLPGLILLAVAEIVRRGVVMRTDLDGLV